MSPTAIHRALGAARSTVYRVAARFLNGGENGLRDRRTAVAPYKVTEPYVRRLETIVYESPQDYGWQRTTWTRELLSEQLCDELNEQASVRYTDGHSQFSGLCSSHSCIQSHLPQRLGKERHVPLGRGRPGEYMNSENREHGMMNHKNLSDLHRRCAI